MAYLASAVSPLFHPRFEIQTQSISRWRSAGLLGSPSALPFRAEHKLNDNDGFYWHGKSYGVKMKLRVATAYVDAQNKRESMRHSADFIYLHRIKSNLPRTIKQTNKNKHKWRCSFSCSCLQKCNYEENE